MKASVARATYLRSIAYLAANREEMRICRILCMNDAFLNGVGQDRLYSARTD